MPKSPLLRRFARLVKVAAFADAHELSTEEALARAKAQEERRRLTRRSLLGGLGRAAVVGAAAPFFRPKRAFAAGTGAPRIAIVGGGLAGLVCADRLAAKGFAATIYEARTERVGGRVWSARGVFPGQVAERGGELIDTGHKMMLGYANALGLTVEDVTKSPGETFYFAAGARRSEAEVVDEWRIAVERMRPDLKGIGSPTFFQHNSAEEALDRTDLASYLLARAGDLPVVRAILDTAYNIEFGVETHEQSALSLLLFMHMDRRSKLAPFGVFSDERYHVVEGNDAIATGIASRLPGPIVLGAELARLAKNGFGELELTMRGASQPERADIVVLTLPFSVLRRLELDPSLGLSADKLRAINTLTYGTNAKTMIGFQGRPWGALGCNGDVYADLAHVQNTWETNWTAAKQTSILTDYSGGDRGRDLQTLASFGVSGCGSCHGSGDSFFSIDDQYIQRQADAFLGDLERVLPGVRAAASRSLDGKLQVVRGHWLPQRYSRGSYIANQPGYFTTLLGLEAQAAGPLKFAGEHTNSFYEWQGYMEGACLSGMAAAGEILGDLKL